VANITEIGFILYFQYLNYPQNLFANYYKNKKMYLLKIGKYFYIFKIIRGRKKNYRYGKSLLSDERNKISLFLKSSIKSCFSEFKFNKKNERFLILKQFIHSNCA
jgi:hypothetical protein